MGTLGIVVCLHQPCGYELVLAPGDLPDRCVACGKIGKWRYLLPAEVKQRIEAYVARLEKSPPTETKD